MAGNVGRSSFALWFAFHALRPEGGKLDAFVAVVAVAAFLVMVRFKADLIPALAVNTLLGVL